MAEAAKILVVGDVHRQWRDADRTFLEGGDHDLVLFVGDLGDEDVELARAVAELRTEKAVMLGNHDAWQSFTRKRPTRKLQEILEVLGEDHIGYGVRELYRGGISIIGARPFSWGGADIRSPELYGELYGVTDMETSAQRIVEAARSAQHRDILVLAHNGPFGLSSAPQDIYGKDFGRPGGDWGDLDLQLALERMAQHGWRVPCVVAGHMHHRVMAPRNAFRERYVMRGGTLFANPAVVPRIRPLSDGSTVGHFLQMTWSAGALQSWQEIWVDQEGRVRETEQPRVRGL